MSRSRQAEKVVTRHGVNAWLVTIGAAIMAFLMLYTVSLSAAANNAASQWEAALTSSATVRIVAKPSDLDGITPVIEEVLSTTPGIVSYSEISSDTQLSLLAPWLGDELPKDVLNLPRLYSVELDRDIFNEEGLVQRLKAEAPAAIWDNHNRWQGPLIANAEQLRFISMLSAGFIFVIFVGLIFITSEATIAANARSISLLRQIGGSDQWIQAGFARRFVTRAFIGAVIGVLAAFFVVRRFLAHGLEAEALSIDVTTWFLIWTGLAIIIGALGVTFISTIWATKRYLKGSQ